MEWEGRMLEARGNTKNDRCKHLMMGAILFYPRSMASTLLERTEGLPLHTQLLVPNTWMIHVTDALIEQLVLV